MGLESCKIVNSIILNAFFDKLKVGACNGVSTKRLLGTEIRFAWLNDI